METQSDVRLVMREPETPGGFKFNMAWRPVSRSVTADAMMLEYVPEIYDAADAAETIRQDPWDSEAFKSQQVFLGSHQPL